MCLLTLEDEASFRKHPAGDGDSGKDTSCPSIRRMRKRGRRRVRRRRPNLLKSFSRDPDVPKEEVTPVDSNFRLKVLCSKDTPSESRCPEAKGKDDVVEDSGPLIQGGSLG